MKKRDVWIVTAAIALSMGLLAGCSDSRKEEEAAYRQIGIDCLESGDYDEAVAAFNSALKQCIGRIGADEIDICYYKAAAQYAGGNIAAAMETYDAIIDYDGKAAGAYYLRGCLYLKQGDMEKGRADFEKAVKYNADDYELYINIYENLSGYGLAGDGETYLKQALSIKGNAMENYESRGRIYFLLGDYDNAVTECTSALKKESTLANLYLARCYEAMGDTANAEQYYQTYLTSGSMDSAALNSLGEIMLDKGKYAEAVSYLEQGLEQENITNRRALMKNLVAAYEYQGDFVSAWNIIQEYVGLYPDEADAQREYVFLKNRREPEQTIEGTIESLDEAAGSTEGAEGSESGQDGN